MNRVQINEKVKKLFKEETIYALKRFSKHIDDLKPDIIVLIARKTICLFDLFNYIGIEKPQGEIVSDRVLDLEIEYFKEKKIVVVDDTLILGTTLKSIRDKLSIHDIDFNIVVFSVDKSNWQKKLIIPDHIQNYYSSEELLDFCITLVKAFSLASIPYLVDFPITNLNLMPKNLFENILNNYSIKKIKLPVNYFSTNELYTFFINDELKNLFFHKVGFSFKSIIDIIKIRVYVSIIDDSQIKVRFVPIVLIKNISLNSINSIFNFLSSFIDSKNKYYKFLEKPEIRLRFIQYYLSYILGKIFVENVVDKDKKSSVIFRSSETINLFGKSIANEYDNLLISDKIAPVLFPIREEPEVDYNNSYRDIFQNINVKGYSILESFQQVFINLFNLREIPARNKVKSGNIEQHSESRLNNGISLSMISSYFCKKLKIKSTQSILEIFSICLDICNDLGLSVPIFCEADNTYFRAFRHGELAKRTVGNIYLFYKFLIAFCDTNEYNYKKGFDKLLIEKLAVFFFRIGTKNRFIEVTDNHNDPSAINIGYYLMGAVLIKNDPNEYFPNKHDEWFLHSYCNKLLKINYYNNKYSFDHLPVSEGAKIKQGAGLKSKQIGNAIGKALKLKKNDNSEKKDNRIPLDIDKLTILVSCYSEIDLAMAIAAELNIYLNWLKQTIKINSKSSFIIGNYHFKSFKSSTVFKAFNQAYYKFYYSMSPDKNIKNIIKETSLYLEKKDKYSKDVWDEYTNRLDIYQNTKIDLGDVNSKTINLVFQMVSFLFETGNTLHFIRYLLEVYEEINAPKITINSKFIFKNLITGVTGTRTIVKKYKKNENIEHGTEIGFMSLPGRHFKGKEKNGLVKFIYSKKNYSFKILKIINDNVEYDSQFVFDEFNNNIEDIFANYPKLNGESRYIPKNHKLIEEKMKEYANCKDKNNLNKILSSTINGLSKDLAIIDSLLNQAKKFYNDSRENLVSLLM